jgi:hypothetical protein
MLIKVIDARSSGLRVLNDVRESAAEEVPPYEDHEGRHKRDVPKNHQNGQDSLLEAAERSEIDRCQTWTRLVCLLPGRVTQ